MPKDAGTVSSDRLAELDAVSHRLVATPEQLAQRRRGKIILGKTYIASRRAFE